MTQAQSTPKSLTAARICRPPMARAPIWFGSVFAGFASIFLIVGWIIGARQQYRLATYLPVSAKVVSTDIRTHQDKNGETYEPIINYAYSVDGVRHQFNRVYPMGSVSSSGNWAWEIIQQYPAGTAITAWYNPSDPSDAFLIPKAHWFPYIFALFPTIFVGLGLFLVVYNLHVSRPLVPVAPDGNGWFRIAENGTFRGRIRISVVGLLLWYAYTGAVIGDYYYLNRQPDPFLYISALAAVALGLFFLIPLFRNWRLCHDFLDADLHISQPQIHPGDTIQLRLRQEILRTLEIEQLSLGVICLCDQRTQSGSSVSYNTFESWNQWRDLAVNRTYQPGSHLELQAHFTIPPDASPSSPMRSRDYPLYRWHVALGLLARGQPKLTALFPIVVEAAR